MSRLMLQAINLLKNGYAGVLPKYVSRTLPMTGTKIKFLYEGDALKKIVTKANGNKVVSTFTKDGKNLVSNIQITPRGKIEHYYGAQNYDKIIQAHVDDGAYFNFLGHKGRNNGILYTDIAGKYDAGERFMPQFKTAMDYIKGLASKSQYQVSKISAMW